MSGSLSTAPAARLPRHDGWTPARIRAFLLALRSGARVSAAAAAAGMSRQGAYAFRRSAAGADFARAWDMARALAWQSRAERAMGPIVEKALQRVRRLAGPRFRVELTLADAPAPVSRRRSPRARPAPSAMAADGPQS